MGKIRDILLNARIQTAGETTVGMAVGYSVGIHDPYIIGLIAVMMFGILYHGIGFTINNLFDYPYDVVDPHKQELPLVAQRLNFMHTRKATYILMWIVFISVLIYTVQILHNPYALLFFVIAVISGLFYNGRNKETNWGQVGIILAFPSMIMFAYSLDHTMNYLAVFVFIYAVLTISFLNLFSGQMKDIGVRGQANFLRACGCNTSTMSPMAISIGFLIKMAAVYVFVYLYIMYPTFNVYMAMVIAAISMFIAILMISGRPSDYRRNQIMAVGVELTAAIAFVVAFVVPLYLIIALILFPIVWLVLFNRVFFNTSFHMKV